MAVQRLFCAHLAVALCLMGVAADACAAPRLAPLAHAAATCSDYPNQAAAQRAAVTGDADGDGIGNLLDNCVTKANPTQCDSDGDGFGNHCDGDLNDNDFTNAQDVTLFRAQLGLPSVGPQFNEADLNCNGFVNAQDATLFRQLLGSPPGPSAFH